MTRAEAVNLIKLTIKPLLLEDVKQDKELASNLFDAAFIIIDELLYDIKRIADALEEIAASKE